MPSYVFLRPAGEKAFTVTKNLESYMDSEYEGLDATCSLRKYWRGRSMKGWIFLDKRREVKPDIVASNEYLPFRSGIFGWVFYDPPSVARGRGQFTGSSMAYRYGWWTRKRDFDKNIQAVNGEFSRILEEEGLLLFKWTEGPGAIRPLAACLSALSNFKVLFDHPRRSKSGNKRSVVHMITLERKP